MCPTNHINILRKTWETSCTGAMSNQNEIVAKVAPSPCRDASGRETSFALISWNFCPRPFSRDAQYFFPLAVGEVVNHALNFSRQNDFFTLLQLSRVKRFEEVIVKFFELIFIVSKL